ncbi:Alpha/beta hydrolase fold-1 [Xylariaceae sp. FL0255]|nr:Alpha/beta hydrolase fold-1 [Xylariaceae sp. FL0255]
MFRKQPPLIFLVPGGCHVPWCFEHIRRALEDRGFDTDSSPLITVGNDDVTMGLVEDAAHIRSVLKSLVESGREVVVVAHSYGGIVASNAVDGALGVNQRRKTSDRGGILSILYLAALVLPPGISLKQALGPERANPPWLDITKDGFIVPKDPIHAFYADIEPKLAADAIAHLKRMPSRILTDVSTGSPWADGVDVGYIFTEEDRAIELEGQKTMASMLPATSFTATLNTSHSPFLSDPARLADVIEESIRHVKAGQK